MPQPNGDHLSKVGLEGIRARTAGNEAILIGIIDGPVERAHPALRGARFLGSPNVAAGSCAKVPQAACRHGTFVSGLLAATGDDGFAGLCPGCRFLNWPVFSDQVTGIPRIEPETLAAAIEGCIDQGAGIINLSLCWDRLEGLRDGGLGAALDRAAERGVLVVAAAGNQSTLGSSNITGHPWVIPVVGGKGAGAPLINATLAPSVASGGVMAPGLGVAAPMAGGGIGTFSGSSAAVPFVTAALALLWSLMPKARARELRWAVAQPRLASSLLPPWLDANRAWGRLRASALPIPIPTKERAMSESLSSDSRPVETPVPLPAFVPADDAASTPAPPAKSCGCAGGDAEPLVPVYALGKIEARFPSAGIEREFQQAAQGLKTKGLTDDQVIRAVLSAPANRYLARQMCWVLSVGGRGGFGGVDAYILRLKDPADLDLLVQALPDVKTAEFVDVVIGQKGPLIPPGSCGNLTAPMLAVDQIYSFDVASMVDAIPKPDKMAKAEFAAAARQLFDRVQQLRDNVGISDDHRAVNYLITRAPRVYALVADQFAQDAQLADVQVLPSRIAGARNLVNVVFTFRSRKTGVEEKFRIRVDASETFPFVATPLGAYFDR
ncbi:MAG: S8 family serine peptidase [Rhodospirillales bacterium]|nr:S8 family serine peptidase [Rhodospirillales bacterium]